MSGGGQVLCLRCAAWIPAQDRFCWMCGAAMAADSTLPAGDAMRQAAEVMRSPAGGLARETVAGTPATAAAAAPAWSESTSREQRAAQQLERTRLVLYACLGLVVLGCALAAPGIGVLVAALLAPPVIGVESTRRRLSEAERLQGGLMVGSFVLSAVMTLVLVAAALAVALFGACVMGGGRQIGQAFLTAGVALATVAISVATAASVRLVSRRAESARLERARARASRAEWVRLARAGLAVPPVRALRGLSIAKVMLLVTLAGVALAMAAEEPISGIGAGVIFGFAFLWMHGAEQRALRRGWQLGPGSQLLTFIIGGALAVVVLVAAGFVLLAIVCAGEIR